MTDCVVPVKDVISQNITNLTMVILAKDLAE